MYILDTGFFVITRNYYKSTFPSFWERLHQAVPSNLISSVEEVKNEIERYGGIQADLVNWLSNHRTIFTIPTIDEQNSTRLILEKFPNFIKKKQMLTANPWADPFVIAKAMNQDKGVVVTREMPASRNTRGAMQGSPKIPDVCSHFGVRCINIEEFMRENNWIF